jgi:hypothetical protein
VASWYNVDDDGNNGSGDYDDNSVSLFGYNDYDDGNDNENTTCIYVKKLSLIVTLLGLARPAVTTLELYWVFAAVDIHIKVI